jgi:hypothetical protein
VRAPKKEASTARKRKDKRSQLLIYMDPKIIRQLKLVALAKERPAYELAEEAIVDWLKRHKKEIQSAFTDSGGSRD